MTPPYEFENESLGRLKIYNISEVRKNRVEVNKIKRTNSKSEIKKIKEG